MQNPTEFYSTQIDFYTGEVSRLKRELSNSATLRFLVFIIAVAGVYFFHSTVLEVAIILILWISVFTVLVLRHTKLNYEKEKNEHLLHINQTELAVLNGNYHHLDGGKEFTDASHGYSYDIDLFGNGSFFQYLNRTGITEGKKALVGFLTENNTDAVELKQEAVKELSKVPQWRQLYTAMARMVKVEHSAGETAAWIGNYLPSFNSNRRWLPILFSLVSLGIFILAVFEVISFKILVTWFFTGLGISGIFLKKINELYKNAGKAKDTFRQYHLLLDMIETAGFKSVLLREKQEAIKTESVKASVIFAKFSKLLDALDQRNNLMIGVVTNAFFLRDVYLSHQIEKWISGYGHTVEKWLDVASFFDAWNTLGNFAFNHPAYVYPSISESDVMLDSKSLGHPLISEKSRITNDFSIAQHQFYIITGANMAGKSTFLRTVSLALVMANMGLPVCASAFKYKPIQLITSMRTSDSLADDESYFFSELKRLKFIVDRIKTDDYFIVLDEILKGTNSTDKAIGSKKFVQKLVASNSTGIIATHDLSLCEIEKELQQIKNYYFDAEIKNDELYFDYKLKNGICKNMNASFLLKKMDIV